MKALTSISLLAGLLMSSIASADITGLWRQIDDETGQAKSEIRIYKEGNQYKGKIEKYFAGTCTTCEGRFHNKTLAGEVIFWGLKADGDDEYEGGTILDPKSDKHYRMTMVDKGSTVRVRGWAGPFFRSQRWTRIN